MSTLLAFDQLLTYHIINDFKVGYLVAKAE